MATSKHARVVAICGPSCSGKSTVATKLAATLKSSGPVLVQDCFFDKDAIKNKQPQPGTVHWLSWDDDDAINWNSFIPELTALHAREGPWEVVEGFLLLSKENVLQQLDVLVFINVDEDVAWERRLARAKWLAGVDPNGTGNDQDGTKNYEILSVYTKPEDEQAAREAGESAHPEDGNLAWLHLYFDQVVLPSSRAQLAKAKQLILSGKIPVLLLQSPKGVPSEVVSQRFVTRINDFLHGLKQ